ncbi:MAG: PAS domain S-box protein, partial [Methylobacter sp.]|nr:PAS domain S-box protein [Methylobacter sp.]
MAGLGSEPRIITDTLDDAGNTTASVNNGLACSAAALAESEERFRQMAEMTGEWLWEQDPYGYYTYSSTAVNQILGFSPDE